MLQHRKTFSKKGILSLRKGKQERKQRRDHWLGKFENERKENPRNLKLGAHAREGVEADKFFSYVWYIVPKVKLLGNQE
jgi:hypothetical protein